MTFAQIHWLWGLAIPVIGILSTIVFKKIGQTRSYPKASRVRIQFSHIALARSSLSQPAKWFFYLGLALVVISLARPQWGKREIEVTEYGRETLIAMDLSKSMLAEDIRPNRLQRAHLVVESLLDNLDGESVGLILFAGSAYLQSPMSPDYHILRGFLRDLSPDYVPQGGTNYEKMLQVAMDSFNQGDSEADRFLIVISDGESQSDEWKARVDELNNKKIRVISLGFGTPEGALIPDGEGGYHKDSNGAVVLTKLQSKTLRELANKTNGQYREATTWIDLHDLIEDTIRKGEAMELGTTKKDLYVERYQYFLGPGLLLLLISLYREFPSTPRSRIIKPQGANAV